LTAGCSAVGGMEEQVLFFDTVPVTFIYFPMVHKSPLFPQQQFFAK